MKHSTRITIEGIDGGPALEAVVSSQNGEPAVVAPPHPLYGGSIDVPVVGAVFRALEACRRAPLAFNWRGVGASAGSVSDSIGDAVADYEAAARHATGAAAAESWIASGYSWGAVAALQASERIAGVERLVLVAPPISLLGASPFGRVSLPLHVVVGSRDGFAAVDAVERALAECGNASLDVIDGADHFFMSTGTDGLEQRLRSRLQKVAA